MPQNKRLRKFLPFMIMLAVVLGITALVVVIRIGVFSVTNTPYGYIDYPVFNMLPPVMIALCIRGFLSPQKRSLWVTILAFVVLLATGIVQEYIVARHMELARGADPSTVPLLPTLTQYLVVMASNISAISFVLIGVFAGTLLTLVISSFTPNPAQK